MPLFENFPYTNFHDLNLDWILKEEQKNTENVNTMRSELTVFEGGITTQQNNFEGGITTQQNTFENVVTSKQNTFENDITSQQNTFENDITSQQNVFENKLDGKYDGFLTDYQRQFGVVQTKGNSTTNVVSQNGLDLVIKDSSQLFNGNVPVDFYTNVEVGTILNDGLPVASTERIRSSDFNPVIDTKFLVRITNSEYSILFHWYDENKDYISGGSVGYINETSEITTLGSYFKIVIQATSIVNFATSGIPITTGIYVNAVNLSNKDLYKRFNERLSQRYVTIVGVDTTETPLSFDTGAKTITVNKCYITFGKDRFTIDTPQTVTWGESERTHYVIYDKTDGLIKVYGRTDTNYNVETSLLIAFFNDTSATMASGTGIYTSCDYVVNTVRFSKIGVKQNTGDSPLYTMSQKAITDNLNGLMSLKASYGFFDGRCTIDYNSTLEVGTILTGSPSPSDIRLRSGDFYKLVDNSIDIEVVDVNYALIISCYNSSKEFITNTPYFTESQNFIFPDNVKYIKLVIKHTPDTNFSLLTIPVIPISLSYKGYDNITLKKAIDVSGIGATFVTKLKVCSYNIGNYAYGTGDPVNEGVVIPQVRKFLNDESFDIIGLQENKTNLGTVTSNDAIYDYLYPYKVDSTNWTSIKSRHVLDNVGTGSFGATGRAYVYGTMNISGKQLFVACVHFSPFSQTEREAEYQELLEILGYKQSFIVFGDFNAGNNDVVTAQDEFDIVLNSGYKSANGSYMGLINTYGGTTRIAYLDNIITSSDITIATSYSANISDNMPSDHIPLICELIIYP